MKRYGFRKVKRRGRPRKPAVMRYGRVQTKVFKKLQAKRRKAYRNRQQLLSIPTVKAIVKKQIHKCPEVNYITYECNNPTENNCDTYVSLGHVGTDEIDYSAIPNITIEQLNKMATARIFLLTDYLSTYVLDNGVKCPIVQADLSNNNGLEKYKTKQKLYLKSLNIKLEVCSPYNKTSSRPCSRWSYVHWALIRTPFGTPVDTEPRLKKIFKKDWFQTAGEWRREEDQETTIKIVKRGKINANPASREPVINSLGFRIIRRNINIPLKRNILLKRYTHGSSALTDATLAGNNNNYNLWLVFYSQQQYECRNTVASDASYYQYNNDFETPVSNTTQTGSVDNGPRIRFSYTLSGFPNC